jgi:hypothetical protein
MDTNFVNLLLFSDKIFRCWPKLRGFSIKYSVLVYMLIPAVHINPFLLVLNNLSVISENFDSGDKKNDQIHRQTPNKLNILPP